MPPLTSHPLETLELLARPSEAGWCPVVVGGEALPVPLANFINFLPARELPRLVAALRQRRGMGVEASGYDYLPAAPAGSSLVEVHDYYSAVQVPEAAFHRLLARFLAAVVQAASTQHDALAAAPWWEGFRQDVAAFTAQLPPSY